MMTPRQEIAKLGDEYRAQARGLDAARTAADTASHAGNLSAFVDALHEVSTKAAAFSNTAGTLAAMLARHGVQPQRKNTLVCQLCGADVSLTIPLQMKAESAGSTRHACESCASSALKNGQAVAR